jgi:DNA invertase Pin-like site-specific DNA recombinase
VSTGSELEVVLGGLERASRDRLAQHWQEYFGAPPPPRTSRSLLVRAVAYKMQERALGGLSPATRQVLCGDEPAPGRRTRSLRPGTVLIREWHGVGHQVTIGADGVLYRGERYGSLSEVARLITGARWSGPRFFGVKAWRWIRRCAVYTRKSSEEGLEQDFNSLHAQREACEAFIRSQRGEGWRLVETGYDDGGLSGGTLERPALRQLFADIAQHRVDTVVVYKVDRLTRSLMDFAKIVELFDRHAVSFVAVTQQFNTTTSMGRLTLNILLSFAQFEREVIGERVRDKIAASKKKGMWMGGIAPLGYAIEHRKLVILHEEAETVRLIFARYRELGSVRLLKEDLDRQGARSKQRV